MYLIISYSEGNFNCGIRFFSHNNYIAVITFISIKRINEPMCFLGYSLIQGFKTHKLDPFDLG